MSNQSDKLLRRFARGFGLEGGVPEEPQEEPRLETADTRPGELLATDFGPVRQVIARRTTGYPYSSLPIEALLTPATCRKTDYLRDRELAGFNRQEALFLDTETTGLSHGAGTVAFLVGLGWFEDDAFVMEQLLLDDYDQEQAQLSVMLQRLSTKRYLVSYNGKSFDRSVLENRLVLHRFLSPKEAHLRLMPHLDLLHLGRRLYGGRLEDHRLGTLERHLLGFLRSDDIPGEMVPQHYFQYMLSGEGRHIDGVLRHNFDDVVSLAHLADHLLALVDPTQVPGDPMIAGNLGKLLAASEHLAEAVECLEASLAMPPPDGIKLGRLLARLYRKLGNDPADCARLWQGLHDAFPNESEPLIELAKLAERQQKDLNLALKLTEQALSLAPEDNGLWTRRERLMKRLR